MIEKPTTKGRTFFYLSLVWFLVSLLTVFTLLLKLKDSLREFLTTYSDFLFLELLINFNLLYSLSLLFVLYRRWRREFGIRVRTEKNLLSLQKAVEEMQVGVTIADPKGKVFFGDPAGAGKESSATITNRRVMKSESRDIQDLLRLHDESIDSIRSLTMPELTASIVSSACSIARADAAILWLSENGHTLSWADSFGTDKGRTPRPLSPGAGFIGRSLIEHNPIETSCPADVECLKEEAARQGFPYAASVPMKGKGIVIGCITILKKSDFLMSDSEKAIVSLFASQAASSIYSARIYEELKDQKEFSEAIFDSAACGIMVLDTEGCILKMNRSGAETFRMPGADMVGRKITDLFPGTAQMLSPGGALGREVSVLLPGMGDIMVGYQSSPFFGPPADKEGVIIIFRDLTEIKELQAEIRKKHHFEAMVKVISGVAHEVRNPLFAIQSIGQILEREIVAAPHLALIRAMLKETGRMKNLIEELLLLNRPSKLNIVDVDLELLLTEICEYPGTKKHRAAVSVQVPPGVTLRADRDKVAQVFINLIDNAGGAGSDRIDITAEKKADGIIVSVDDNGPGIKKENLEKIFEPFFTTKKEGTGLGLPICRKIIEDHGGLLEIESAEGEGTTAVITFKTGIG